MTSPATAHEPAALAVCPWLTCYSSVNTSTITEPLPLMLKRFNMPGAHELVRSAAMDAKLVDFTINPDGSGPRTFVRPALDHEVAQAAPAFVARGVVPLPRVPQGLRTVRLLASAIAAFGPVYSSDDETLTSAQADRLHELCELLMPEAGEANTIKLAHAIHAATDLELFYHVSRFEWAYFTKVDDELCTRMATELGCPSNNSYVHGCLGRLCRTVLVDMMSAPASELKG